MKLILNKFILWLLLSTGTISAFAMDLDAQLRHLTTQKTYMCMNYHRAEASLVGLSCRKISEKYNKLVATGALTREVAETQLARAILKRQTGQWSEVIAMPPNQVQGSTVQANGVELDRDGDLKMRINWILALASH
jgi:cytochrome c551/c552